MKNTRILGLSLILLVFASFGANKTINKKAMATRHYKLSSGASPAATTITKAYKFSTTARTRAIYMDKENSSNLIIGNTPREDEFVTFITANDFNAVYMYDLNTTLSTNQGRLNCANFVERLHSLSIKAYAVGGSEKYLVNLATTNSRVYYQNQMLLTHRDSAMFDGLNLENEAWRYPLNDNSLTWGQWQDIILKCKVYTKEAGFKTDAYIGNLIDKQNIKSESQLAKFIVTNCDDIEMHCYMNSTKALTADAFYNYILKRLSAIGIEGIKQGKRYKVRVIFSASPGKVVEGQTIEIHMFDYLKSRTLQYAYLQLINSLNKYDWPGKAGIDMDGYTGYAFQDLKAAYAFH